MVIGWKQEPGSENFQGLSNLLLLHFGRKHEKKFVSRDGLGLRVS